MHQAGIENVVASSGTALSSDQIRLINRLTKNITVLFDGDAAGLRASVRGIDLILEEGMNVKVCTFPDGDDPDSFARKNSYEDLVLYLETNAKDFIQFKASLLMKEANNDPIKKADLIRDMVVSISKIPDRIKREIYIQECSRIMDISEQVLLNTLAQMVQKDISEAGKKLKQEYKALEVVKEETSLSQEKVDILSNLETSIISILVRYGNLETDFENIYVNFDEEGNENETIEKVNCKISERIFLSLQEDEVSFTNEFFKDVYNDLIHQFVNNQNFDITNYINSLPESHSSFISNLIMEDEKYSLSGWLEKKQVFVKVKDSREVLTSLVTETLISLREFLINKLVSDMVNNYSSEEGNDIEELKSTINDYNKLKVNLTNKIGRIRSTYL